MGEKQRTEFRSKPGRMKSRMNRSLQTHKGDLNVCTCVNLTSEDRGETREGQIISFVHAVLTHSRGA